MTELLYYNDSRLSRFKARLLHQEPANGLWAVILDRTAFYPEGGGQPADTGKLNDVAVVDVQKRGEEVLHYLNQPLEPDRMVEGIVDWSRRFEYMQQHTGQHIVSASLIAAAGHHTVSAYLGPRYTAVEIATDSIGEEEIEAAASLANRRVCENRPVHIHWVRPEEAQRFALRKPPPDVQLLRIVEIEGLDCAACAGVHTATTGEVGLIKYDGLERIRGRLRLHWLIGERAFGDMRYKDRLTAALNRELTCGSEDILNSVVQLKTTLREKEQRIALLERSLAEQEIRQLLERAEKQNGIRIVRAVFRGRESSMVQAIYQNLLEQPQTVVLLVNLDKSALQWRIGCSDDLDLPWKRILPGLYPLIGAKGGGRSNSWQGVGGRPEQTDGFLDAVQEALRERLQGGPNG